MWGDGRRYNGLSRVRASQGGGLVRILVNKLDGVWLVDGHPVESRWRSTAHDCKGRQSNSSSKPLYLYRFS